ncbi:MAG: hypothetical protein K2I84_02290 [Bacteroidales bacterium]|nr:hypothetical protein [Bacteroidales bacterium]
MKKLTFIMMLVLTAGLFTSCQKGENFFNGTWQAVTEYEYRNQQTGDWNLDVCTIELTLEKKNGEARLEVDFPKNQDNNIMRNGSYTYYNENTVAVTLPKTTEEDEWVMILYRLPEDNHKLYCDYFDSYFTKLRN